jgi:hypothetical protein
MEILMESHEILMNSPMMVHGGPGWLENSHENPIQSHGIFGLGDKVYMLWQSGLEITLKTPGKTHTIP